MNVQNLLSSFSQTSNGQSANSNPQARPLDSISSILPGGLAGGAAAGGIMALLMGSKSTRKIAKKIMTFGGTAVVGGLAYKACDNWQNNKALGQTRPITDEDIEFAADSTPFRATADSIGVYDRPLKLVLIETMIAASKADGQIDSDENRRLFEAIEQLNFDTLEKGQVFDAMAREITVEELAHSISLEEHKAEVYLAAYMAINLDNQHERTFLNNLALALSLPKGFPAYLEQQADIGVAA